MGDGASGTSGATTYFVPTLKITKIACTQKHPLKQLFVLFRPTPPAPSDPSVGQKITSMFSSGSTSAALSPPYVLGMTDTEGFLGPPIDLATPESFETIPDAYKLMPGQSYDVYLIQHPSLALAQRIEADINAGSTLYGKPRSFKVKTDEAVLEVPEESAGLLPAGSDLYGGFILYRDMPFGACEPIKKQVQRLQAHLGALRYPVGTTNWPYLPDVGQDSDKSGGVNDGIFDVRVMNAVFRYQQDALGGRAFKVNGGGASGAHGALVDYGSFDPKVDRGGLTAMQAEAKALKKSKTALTEDQKAQKTSLDAKIKEEQGDIGKAESLSNAWAYLDGQEVSAPGEKPIAADGVVDAATSKSIKTWLEQGLRKPGAILVVIQDPRTWKLWVRPEAAKSWHAWNELVRAMGFEHGVCVNHTFRSAQVDIGKAGYGRSARSIHKTGLAMDLGLVGDFVNSVPCWPVAYVREIESSRVKWRLYGPAKQTLPAAGADAARIVAPILERLGKLKEEQSKSPIVAEMLLSAIDTISGEINGSPTGFLAKYYKASIERWVYDAWHPEGGTPGAMTSASSFYASHEAKDAGSAGERGAFLDLTAVAWIVGLTRISSFKSGWGQTTKTVKAADLKALADALDKAGSAQSDDDKVTIARGKTLKMTTTVPMLDTDFMRRWDDTLKAAKKEISKSVKTNTPWMTVSLSWSAAKIEDAKKVAAKLREFSDKLFYGSASDETLPPVQTGEAWAKYIEERPQQLEAQAPANQNVTQNTGASVSSSKQKSKTWTVTVSPVFEKGYSPPTDVTNIADTIKILAGDSITLPAPGQPIGMEWWHFQRSDLLVSDKTRKQWGSFLMDVGWTRECLLENTGPALYHRAGVGYPESELTELAY